MFLIRRNFNELILVELKNTGGDKMGKGLTAKQQRFIEEYLIDLNAKQAAIRAGYAPRSAEVVGTQVLRNPKVSREVAKAIAERSRRTGITQDRVLRELARIAFFNASDVMDLNSGEIKQDAMRDDTAVIAGVRTKTIPSKNGKIVEREIKTYDKLRALELLGKHLGMFDERLKVEMDVNLVDILKKAWEYANRNEKENKNEEYDE